MTRLLLRLLGIKDFEVCQSCETLKQQLLIANEDRQRLTDTLINILQPKVLESAPIEINQIAQTSALFSRRRAALEAKDREEAKILKSSNNLGKPDIAAVKNINDLEKELGVEEKEA